MLNIDFLQNSWYFKKISLNSGDILFDEWSIDDNLYFILKWELFVEKYTSIERKNTKKLAVLKDMDFFWEWSLNNSKPKEVKIIANTNTTLLAINAKDWLNKLIKKYPLEWLDLLKHLINLTNSRLLESNSLFTATYEINRKILSLDNITIKSIFEIINTIKSVIWCDYILYLEKYEYIDKTLVLKYNTSKHMKMLDILIELKSNKLELNDLENFKDNYNFIQNLSVWDRDLWYLIFCNKNKDFTENQKKIILSITPSLSWIIRQKEVYDEKRDIDYIKW